MENAEQIWMDGEFIAWDDAQVHFLTHALHYGTAVFEGIRAYETPDGTAIFRLREHIERLARSATGAVWARSGRWRRDRAGAGEQPDARSEQHGRAGVSRHNRCRRIDSSNGLEGETTIPMTSLHLRAAAGTHPGQVYQLNQDKVFAAIRPSGQGKMGGLFIVADGMGGHQAGEIASDLAVQTIRKELAWFLDNNDGEDTQPTMPSSGMTTVLDGAADLFTLYGRAKGTFKDPNVYAPFLVLPLLFLIETSLRERIRIIDPARVVSHAPEGKAAVYRACIQAGMRDLAYAVRDPSHRLVVTGQDGYDSLRMAIEATKHVIS